MKKEKLDRTIQFRISRNLKNQTSRVAREEFLPGSEIIRKALKYYIRKRYLRMRKIEREM